MADASPSMGTGHIMRCIALAQAARTVGADVHILSRCAVEWVRKRLYHESFSISLLDQPAPSEDTPHECLRRLREIAQPSADTCVVLDGYHFTCECQKAIREAGYRLLLIDDYAHLAAYSCEYLLNPSTCADDFTYRGDIKRKFLGPRYALLRQEFLDARTVALQQGCPDNINNILITLGGGNFIGALIGLIAELNNLISLRGKKIRIIKGAMKEGEILKAFTHVIERLEIISNVIDMPELLLDTDLCITAGGSTCFELCCLGVPFITVEIAKNQHDSLMCLTSKYGIPYATNAMLAYIVENHSARLQIRRKGLSLVDGMGALRIINSIFK